MNADSSKPTRRNPGWLIGWLSVACLLLGTNTLVAAGLQGMPSYYPDRFDFSGHIQSVDPAQRELVVDDQTVLVPRGVPIASQQSRKELFSVFREGMRIGFNGGYDRSGRLYMDAAWVIPDRLRLPAKDDEQEDG